MNSIGIKSGPHPGLCVHRSDKQTAGGTRTEKKRNDWRNDWVRGTLRWKQVNISTRQDFKTRLNQQQMFLRKKKKNPKQRKIPIKLGILRHRMASWRRGAPDTGLWKCGPLGWCGLRSPMVHTAAAPTAGPPRSQKGQKILSIQFDQHLFASVFYTAWWANIY